MIRTSLSYAALLGLVYFLKTNFSEWVHFEIYSIWVFFAILGYLSLLLHHFGFRKNREKLFSFHMATQGVRFILSLIFVGFFAYHKTANIYLFMMNFFVLYLFSTYFEISGLLRKLRRF